ncbi:ubiquitin-specific protease doa4 [Rhodotorula kratochvilovae]
MAVSSQRPPPSLDELRARSHDTLAHLRPTDFAVRAWSRAAQTAFDHADKAWREGRANNDHAKVAEAFLEYKRAAGILQIISKHPQYKEVVQAKSEDYYAVSRLKEMVMGAKASQEQVVAWLERREVEAARPAQSSVAGGSSAADSSPGYANGTRADASTSRPQPHKTPSFPTTSLADRMAKLRASGLPGATAAKPQPSPPSSPKRPSTPTRSPRQTAIPLSPTAPSPRAPRTGDAVADNAGGRSGSAPPVLPYSNVQEPATVWEDSALQFRPEGGTPIASRQKGVIDRGPAGGVGVAPDHGETAASSANFASAFPSLDDFERGIDVSASSSGPASASSSSYSFPSVPSFDPATASARPARPPPPHPPKPPHLDERTFIREQKERADAMAKLAAGQGGGSLPSTSTNRASLPAALVPGGKTSGSAAPSSTPARRPSTSAPLPPPTASSKAFKIPFAADVRPAELWQYLQTSKAETGEGPRVLLLDLRTREEYERGRVKAETVCLEPIILRDGIRSTDIEDALSLSPPHEAALFAARHHYDLVVVYDRSSSSLPGSQPTSTSSDAQRVLWNLINAIYEREFVKHLRRQPLLLVGGWEAWERKVGAQGIVGTGTSPRLQQEEADRAEAKRAHRRAAVHGEVGSAVVRNGSGDHPSNGAYFPSSGYAPVGSSSSNPVAGLISPRLAMPPVAAQRSGPAPSYDPFAASSHARPSYAQPQADPYGLPASPTSSPSMPRTRSGTLDLYGAPQPSGYINGGDYSRPSVDYARPSIDYPQLQHRAPPSISQSNRPPPPPPPGAYSPVPSVPLTRPPPIKPAPIRSNSSFSSMQPAQYSAAHSRFPTGLLSFDEGVIGISGLKNLGNTCYMNSTIQCLSAAVPFARYFTGGTYRKDINVYNPLGTKGALANAVAELIRALWAQQYHFLSPVTFRENICRVAPQFRGSEQHDAQEFLGFLLDGLHEDCNYVVKKPPPVEMTPEREHDLETLPPQVMSDREWQIYKMRNDSFIVQCFQGQFRNQLRCLTCQKTSTTYNTFMPLSVPIPGGRGVGKVSLMACLEQFVRDEVLDGDDAWHCPRCKKNRKAVKKLSLSKLPPILVIHLKRFSFHGPFSDKIETQVQYPLSGLDLTHFLPPPMMDQNGQSSAPPKGYMYDLFGVTNHYGNLSSGHYTAFVRSGRDWFNIGDSKVTPADPGNVSSAKSAYILYYTLRT